MKKITFVLIFLFLNVYSQFKLNYTDIQLEYRNHYTHKNYFEVSKIINENEEEYADFIFSKKDSSLVSIHFKKSKGYSDIDAKKLINKFIVDFSPTKVKTWENWSLYYDEKNKILLIKAFENHSSEKIKEINITIDSEIISNMLLNLFNSGINFNK
ncbi:hypothetical protein NHF50_13955 [Flavobacterium sp. NRK F10]|uniref:hypothetical protein n=1 Tax=Flavobacterium sp. NRK F10 TaxID=2954931 RepID=UPI00209195F6|nr:hypothetical protein [Flavobacterium sp. NRK F10]MCO6176152.1 hypothetical protein [Flavobacterium sp. NRK F10]